jgi:hypothetical protein
MIGVFAVATFAAATAASAGAKTRQLIPTTYEAGHFFATPETRDGKVLRLLVDTGGPGGGGWYVLDEKAVRRMGLAVDSCRLGTESLSVLKTISFLPAKAIPTWRATPCHSVALVRSGYLSVAGEDGSLGAGFLPHFIWTFDYPGQKLWREPSSWKPEAGMHRTSLGFMLNAAGEKGTGFPRITLTVDGRPLEMLLDTGATAMPTAEGQRVSGMATVQGIGVTSYVTTSVLDQWHRRHPDWRIVAFGDKLGRSKARTIEVPRVEIAGWAVGPVWFTERADANYGTSDGAMSSYMDRKIEGSAGANIFDHFVMALDYPRSAAWFECVRECRKAGSK